MNEAKPAHGARVLSDIDLEIVATDIDPVVIKRAEKGCYQTISASGKCLLI